MISTSDFKNGATLFVDGEPYRVLWFQHHKPGKGGAVMRTKLKHLRNGSIVERTFKSGERFENVEVTRQKKQFLYAEGSTLHFMDIETYDQIEVPKEKVGDMAQFLTENMEVTAIYLEGEFLDIDLPPNVVMKVVTTEPGARGNTVSGATKQATLETGVVVNVPLFIKEGELVRVDTRTGEYIERAS